MACKGSDDGACQRFARDDASTYLTCQGVASPSGPVDLRELGGTAGDVWRSEATARPWHARGQGFKSPQLHQAQRISRPPTQGRLSADCQQITLSICRNTPSADRLGGFGLHRSAHLVADAPFIDGANGCPVCF
jgi:hypothetical protein